jgi:DNA-binding MarR family transcriptional regulator
MSPAKSLAVLLHDVSRLLRRQMDQRAQSLGLTSAQWRVLASVARAELLNQEPLSQASLAEQMDMEPITLSRHIDRMQAAGMIERRPNPADRRAYHLHITESARELVGSFRTIGSECMASALDGVSEEEIASVTNVLSRMRANLVGRTETVEPPTEATTTSSPSSSQQVEGRVA